MVLLLQFRYTVDECTAGIDLPCAIHAAKGHDAGTAAKNLILLLLAPVRH